MAYGENRKYRIKTEKCVMRMRIAQYWKIGQLFENLTRYSTFQWKPHVDTTFNACVIVKKRKKHFYLLRMRIAQFWKTTQKFGK